MGGKLVSARKLSLALTPLLIAASVMIGLGIAGGAGAATASAIAAVVGTPESASARTNADTSASEVLVSGAPRRSSGGGLTVGRLISGSLSSTGDSSVPSPSSQVELSNTAYEGETISFRGSFTDPGLLDTHTFEWDFGDGTTVAGLLDPSHVYSDDGIYVVTLMVTDSEGDVGTALLDMTIVNRPPSVYLGPDRLVSVTSRQVV